MLSIKGLVNSGVTVNYFAKDDYYTKDNDDQPSAWFGEGAKDLGLQSDVVREDFQAILEGKLPGGEIMGKIRNFELPENINLKQFSKTENLKLGDILSSKDESGNTIFLGLSNEQQELATALRTSDVVSIEGNTAKVLHHRPGWDLTFSAPKGVSIMAEVGEDKRLLQAHDKAVQVALSYLEKNGLATRINEKGEKSLDFTEKMVAALFTHNTSRELDPQLHTHSVIMNITKRSSGEYRTLESKEIFNRKMLGGLIYRAELAKSVQQLGYDINNTDKDGRFDIANVPDDLKKSFSTRREQIEQVLKNSHSKNAKTVEKIALNTRIKKTDVKREDMNKIWHSITDNFGFNAVQMTREATEASLKGKTILSLDINKKINDGKLADMKPELIVNAAEEGVRFAAAKLSEREASFSHEVLLFESLKYDVGNVSVSQVQSAIKSLDVKNELIHAVLDKEKKGWTTNQAILLERISHSIMKDGRGKTEKIATQRELRKSLSNWGFNKGQMDSAVLILNSKDRVIGVQGFAGTGKTYMLGAVKEIAEKKGFEVVGVAPSATAANTLKVEAGIESNTLAKHLINVNRAFAESKKIGQVKLNLSKQIWAVDEGSMIANKDMASLLRSAERTGAKVVLIGDKKQLTAVDAGKPFHLLQQAGMKTAVMDEIRRQENQQLLGAVKDSITGQAGAAFEKIKNTVYEYDDSAERIDAVAKHYLSFSKEDRDNTFVLSPANEDRVKLNDVIRKGLINENSIQVNKSVNSSIFVKSNLTNVEKGRAIFYHPGDVIRFGRSNASLGIKSGEYIIVDRVDKKLGVVGFTNNKGKEVRWKPNKTILGKGRSYIELYKKQKRELAKNDQVRWTRNNNDKNIRNAETAKVMNIKDKNVTFKLHDGSQITIDIIKPENRHWDYAYASTVHASQGGTVKNVIVNGEDWRKNLVNQKMFYVAISRAKENAFVYVNNKDKFINAIKSRTGDKTSALETLDHRKYQHKTKEEVNRKESRMGLSKNGLVVDSLKKELSLNLVGKAGNKELKLKELTGKILGGR